MTASPETVATPNNNIDELSRLVNLPLRPQSVLWELRRLGGNTNPEVPGPTDWEITAVLIYSQSDAEKVAAAAAKIELPVADDLELKEWFPEQIKTAATKINRYRADAYFRSPYYNGGLFRFGVTGYFVLQLFTT